MLYEFHLDESYGTNLTAAERNALIRFCLSIGTRAKCSTRVLLRPFKQKYLTTALREMKGGHLKSIAEYEKNIELYNRGELPLPQGLIDYFEGPPTKERFEKYMRALIRQERGVMRMLSKSYQINVDFAFTNQKLLGFHKTLNPRVTFGYSNSLHEECDFPLTEKIRDAFLNASLKDLPSFKQDWMHDWGYVFFGSCSELLYEDLEVFLGERYLLSTLSHEKDMTVSLTEEELAAFYDFEGKRRKNIATVGKLKSLQSITV